MAVAVQDRDVAVTVNGVVVLHDQAPRNVDAPAWALAQVHEAFQEGVGVIVRSWPALPRPVREALEQRPVQLEFERVTDPRSLPAWWALRQDELVTPTMARERIACVREQPGRLVPIDVPEVLVRL